MELYCILLYCIVLTGCGVVLYCIVLTGCGVVCTFMGNRFAPFGNLLIKESEFFKFAGFLFRIFVYDVQLFYILCLVAV